MKVSPSSASRISARRCSRRFSRAATRSPASSARRRSRARSPTRCGSRRRRRGCKVFQFASLRDPEAHAGAEGARRRASASWRTCCSSPRQDFVQDPEARARSSTTRRCCRSIAARARSTGRSSRARPRPASRSSGPPTGWTKARSCCRRRPPIGPDDTLGYGLLRPALPDGRAGDARGRRPGRSPGSTRRSCRTKPQAIYEGWCRAAEAKIDWANHVDFVYNLIRGSNPAPGAWTTLNGKKLQIFDARKHLVRTFGAVKGKPGEVSEVTDASFFVTAQGGRIEVLRAKPEDGKKASGPEVAAALGIAAGTLLGT